MSFQKRLSALKDSWNKDKPAKGTPSLPQGDYQFQIKRALIEESKASFNKGHMQVHFELVVLTGEHKGRTAHYRIDLEQPKTEKFPSGISRFKGVLENLGLDLPADITEKSIAAILKQCIGIALNGAVRMNAKGYANVYMNEAINSAAESEDDEEEIDEEEAESEDESEEDESEDEAEEKPQPKAKAPTSKPQPAAKAKAKADFDDDWDDE